MVNADPQGPKFHIEAFDPGEMRPEHRSFLYCSGFLITRTYCLHAHLRSARSLQITNKVFSDSQGALLHGTWNRRCPRMRKMWPRQREHRGERADGDEGFGMLKGLGREPGPNQETSMRSLGVICSKRKSNPLRRVPSSQTWRDL